MGITKEEAEQAARTRASVMAIILGKHYLGTLRPRKSREGFLFEGRNGAENITARVVHLSQLRLVRVANKT